MKTKLRKVWYGPYLLTQIRYKGRWITVPQGAKGPKVSMPKPDKELTELNRQWLQLAIDEATRGPTELETSLEELTRMGIDQQKKFMEEGPTIPEHFKTAIRESFDVARSDTSKAITDQFTQFVNQARRDLIGRGIGGEGSSALTDMAGFATAEQGKAMGDAFSRISAAQSSAEISGATDLAEMVMQALNLSSGRLSETANRKIGLLGGGNQQAGNYFQNLANQRLQVAMANAGAGGGFSPGAGFGGAAGGAAAGALMGSAAGGIGAIPGGIIGGIGGLAGGFR